MNPLEQHEIFEMEVLERLKSSRILEQLIFGGGTMLRLCHELPRYSVDLDFWKSKDMDDEQLLIKIQSYLKKYYEITDAQLKRFTVLVEMRSSRYPRRLKIEIRRERRDWEVEDRIAFSPYSPIQVLVRAHTLQQTLRNKIEALIDRGAIRDAFDLEFIIRKGISLPRLSSEQKQRLLDRIHQFKPRDFKVTLGALIPANLRDYYIKNGFRFLEEKISESDIV